MMLRQIARKTGQVRVIVGLRMALRMEDTLSQAEVDSQQRRLRATQDAVAARVLGSASAPGVDRFTFIPYMSLLVDAAQLDRLLADPQVVSIYEDVPERNLLNDSIPLTHTDKIWAKGYTGTGYAIAILDSGVDKTHPMLRGKVLSEACYSTDNAPYETSLCPGRVTELTKPGSGVNCPVGLAGCGHGTHVAAIAAGRPAGVVTTGGVARGANIIAIQVEHRDNRTANCRPEPAPCLRILISNQIKGLNRVYDLRNTYKISSVNISQGSFNLTDKPCDNDPRAAAIAKLRSVNIATIISAGNNGSDSSVSFPACISTAISVGNSGKPTSGDPQGLEPIHQGSNLSRLVKLMAPGTKITAALPSGFGTFTGTSQAAPHVAGAFALLRKAKPNATVKEILDALTCSGKTVERNRIAKPRIDLLGAYNWLLGPPGVHRAWQFEDVKDALDWTPFLGKWRVEGGEYKPRPGDPTGVVISSTANCNSSLEIVAKMKRVHFYDPTNPSVAPAAGIWVKSAPNYKTRKFFGYFFGYAYFSSPNPDARGFAYILKWEEDTINQLCHKSFKVPVKFRDWNTVKAVSNGASHSLYINGKFICQATSPARVQGPVGVGTVISDSYKNTGGTLEVDFVDIKSLDSAKSAAEPPEIDAAAFASQAGPSTAKAILVDGNPLLVRRP